MALAALEAEAVELRVLLAMVLEAEKSSRIRTPWAGELEAVSK